MSKTQVTLVCARLAVVYPFCLGEPVHVSSPGNSSCHSLIRPKVICCYVISKMIWFSLNLDAFGVATCAKAIVGVEVADPYATRLVRIFGEVINLT